MNTEATANPPSPATNLDAGTVDGFGQEWTHFDQSNLPEAEAARAFDEYFSLFPWASLPPDAAGFDLGCGSGRWARRVAPRVGTLHCIDASADALGVTRRNLAGVPNCQFHHASVDAIPLADGSMDFGYSLGVLHHVPDTAAGLAACVRKLKRGAPFLVYLYYALDNRSPAFRAVWRASDLLRRGICRLPYPLRFATTSALATTVYLPLARTARLAERLGLPHEQIPLAAYRNLSFTWMRTDAYDRFATQLEQRFSRKQIAAMMQSAGLERVTFREGTPYWCALGYRT